MFNLQFINQPCRSSILISSRIIDKSMYNFYNCKIWIENFKIIFKIPYVRIKFGLEMALDNSCGIIKKNAFA